MFARSVRFPWLPQRALLRALSSRDATGTVSLNLAKRENILCADQTQKILNTSCRSYITSSESSFHGIDLPEGEGKGDLEALQYSNNDMVPEAQVVITDEDKRKMRESIAEFVRAELSAYSTPKQSRTQNNDDDTALEGYDSLLHKLSIAQARYDMLDKNDTNSTSERIQCMMDLGELHYLLGDMEKSQEMFMLVLKRQFDHATDACMQSKMVVAQCLHSLGAIHARCGEFNEAYRWYEEALKRKNEIIKESKDENHQPMHDNHFELGKTYNALAALQTMRGVMNWADALAMFQLAESHQLRGHVSDDINDEPKTEMESNNITKEMIEKMSPNLVQSIVNIRFNIGKLLQQHSQYDDAVAAFRDALELARLDVERMSLGDDKVNFESMVGHPSPFERKNAVVELLVQIADCHSSAQNYDEAAQAYEEALGYHIFFRQNIVLSKNGNGIEGTQLPSTFSSTNNRLDIANATRMEAAVRSNLAHALAHIGQEKLGIEHYEASLKIKRHLGGDNHVECAHTLMGIGAVYSILRNFATALNCFKEALFIYRRNMDELTNKKGQQGSNRFFGDEETEVIDGCIQNALKNIGLIEAGLMKVREDGIMKKER